MKRDSNHTKDMVLSHTDMRPAKDGGVGGESDKESVRVEAEDSHKNIPPA